MEWLFTRGRDGGYAVQVANDVVQKLVEERGYEFMQRLSDWYEENAGNSIQTHARAWRVSEKSIRNIVAHYEKMLAEHGQSAEQHRAPENLPTDQEREFWTSAAGNVPY
jgi:transposase